MKNLNIKIQEQFLKICSTGKLFEVEIPGEELWNYYLFSFKKEDDPVFRDPNSSIHNCNICRSFIKRYANVVGIINNKIVSIFDVDCEEEYKQSMKKLNEVIVNSKINNVFVETKSNLDKLAYGNNTNNTYRLGISKNIKDTQKEESLKYGVVKPNELKEFNHFHLDLPKEFVNTSRLSIETLQGKHRDDKNVFLRGLEEISLDTLDLVIDLINQGSLLDGTTHIHKVKEFRNYKVQYDSLKAEEKDNFCWVSSYNFQFARFKNELIGTLCYEISAGEDLNKACLNWNKRVDPVNYMKTSAPISKKQIEEAKKFIEEKGYEESFDRRFATIDAIKVSEILHSNIGNGTIKKLSIFDNVKATKTNNKIDLTKVEEVSIEKFMQDILPNCTEIEAYLENRLENNMVSLTTTNIIDSKPIFKWDNNYSWTYNGNLAGKSLIKEAVKDRGGKIDAPVRVSLFFPNTTDDYDLHCFGKNHIYYSNRRTKQYDTGMLDLDSQGADGNFPPEKRVENITYSNISKMGDKTRIEVNNYNQRGLHTLFDIEIEIDSNLTLLRLKSKSSSNTIHVGDLIKKDNKIELVISNNMDVISSNTISKEIYGLKTNDFYKVNLVCLSPNHWGDNNAGNKHYFFMLDGCKTSEKIRSFHTENLSSELLEHKKVLEVLGATTMIDTSEKQLSGLGFNSTIKDDLVVKLQGTHQRLVKIRF